MSIFSEYLMPFNLSLVLLLLLGTIETVGLFLGFKPSQLLRNSLPKWLTQLPILNVQFSKVIILIFLFINFSFAGYVLQLAYYAQQNEFAQPAYIILPALIIAIFFTVFMIHCLDQALKPHVSQYRTKKLLGRLATISQGCASPGISAQARVRDEYGQIYYIQVEPEFGELELHSKVILIHFKQTHYVAKKIAHSNQLFAPK